VVFECDRPGSRPTTPTVKNLTVGRSIRRSTDSPIWPGFRAQQLVISDAYINGFLDSFKQDFHKCFQELIFLSSTEFLNKFLELHFHVEKEFFKNYSLEFSIGFS